jgi:hypothetical protein
MAQRIDTVFNKSLSDLAQEFNFKGRIKYIDLPRALHDSYINLYECVENAVEKLGSVLLDGEHALILSEGRGAFTLPPDDYFDAYIENAKKHLKILNPYRFETTKAEHVRISASQMEGFLKVFTAGYDLLWAVSQTLKESDYLACLRAMRARGVAYAGPTAVAELRNLSLSFDSVRRQHEKFVGDMRLSYGLETAPRNLM